MTGEPGAPRITEVMADMALAMQTPGDVTLTFRALTACATDTVEGADHASISVAAADMRPTDQD